MVLVPATTGDFGILPGHVPTVSQLRPGVVSVHVNDKDVKKVRRRDESNPSASASASKTLHHSAFTRSPRWQRRVGQID